MPRRVLIVLLFAVLTACGSSDGPSSGSGGDDAGETGGSGTGGSSTGGSSTGGSSTGGSSTGGSSTGGSSTGGSSTGGSSTGGSSTGGSSTGGTTDPCATVDCSSMDDECHEGVCDPDTGNCLASPVSDGTLCDDGDVCTTADTCSAGACGGSAKDCSGMDGSCLVGACNSTSGECEAQPAIDNAVCDDGDLCTIDDKCTGGVCAGAPKNCSAEDGECIAGVCDPSDGACVPAAAREGETCYPECFNGGTCHTGECTCSDGPCLLTEKDSAGCGINFWCGIVAPDEDPCAATSLATSFYDDGFCDCGCAMPDPDCNNCGDATCDTNHCDGGGAARADCPVSFKSNGVCDCGCQFVDPECASTQFCADTIQVCSDGFNNHDCPTGTTCGPFGQEPSATLLVCGCDPSP